MKLIQLAHLFSAMLSVWRLVDLFTADAITLKLRQRFPWYVFSCQRCFSVWAGIIATALFFFWPWGNWPLALSWLYLWHNESVAIRRATQYRDLHIRLGKDNRADVLQNQLFPHEITALLGQMIPKQGP